MFKLATCHEFVELKKKYPNFVPANERTAWGLKTNGGLFVVDQIFKLNPQKILEVGAGLNPYFCNRFGSKLEYWMIDNGDFYPNPETFREKKSSWKKASFVDGLMGDFSPDLPENYFDMVFSISVLEHTPREPKTLTDDVCKDMYRVLKPGGCVCHTIDIVPSNNIGKIYLKSFKEAGFIFHEEPHDLDWDVGKRDNQILLEGLHIVYQGYYKKFHERNQPIVYYHFGSILVLAYKGVEG